MIESTNIEQVIYDKIVIQPLFTYSSNANASKQKSSASTAPLNMSTNDKYKSTKKHHTALLSESLT